MGDTPTMLSPGEVDSIVLGAADNEVKRLGLTIEAPAKDWLLRKSLRTLNDLNERAQIDSRRSEIERNTVSLIQLTFHEVLKDQQWCANYCAALRDCPFCILQTVQGFHPILSLKAEVWTLANDPFRNGANSRSTSRRTQRNS